jgi:hypothetical protein
MFLEVFMHYISILSTITTFFFAVAVFNRYRSKKGTHLLFWGIGLVFYGLGTLPEVLLSFAYSGLALKLWYLNGAMLTAAWLGQGTVFLLVRQGGVAKTLAIILGVLSLVAMILIAIAPLSPTAAATYDVSQVASTQYKALLYRSGFTIFLTIILNTYGTLTLVGGALYSAFLFWRKRVLVNRMLGNILIAGGALLPAIAGTFVKAGLGDWLYLSEFLGAVLMYAGFTLATTPQPVMNSAITAPLE